MGYPHPKWNEGGHRRPYDNNGKQRGERSSPPAPDQSSMHRRENLRAAIDLTPHIPREAGVSMARIQEFLSGSSLITPDVATWLEDVLTLPPGCLDKSIQKEHLVRYRNEQAQQKDEEELKMISKKTDEQTVTPQPAGSDSGLPAHSEDELASLIQPFPLRTKEPSAVERKIDKTTGAHKGIQKLRADNLSEVMSSRRGLKSAFCKNMKIRDNFFFLVKNGAVEIDDKMAGLIEKVLDVPSGWLSQTSPDRQDIKAAWFAMVDKKPAFDTHRPSAPVDTNKLAGEAINPAFVKPDCQAAPPVLPSAPEAQPAPPLQEIDVRDALWDAFDLLVKAKRPLMPESKVAELIRVVVS